MHLTIRQLKVLGCYSRVLTGGTICDGGISSGLLDCHPLCRYWRARSRARPAEEWPRCVLLHAGSAEEEKVYLHILTKAFNILVTSKARTLCSCIDFPPNS